MKPLSKFLLAILLLTVASVGWGACPEGYRNNYKGECVKDLDGQSVSIGEELETAYNRYSEFLSQGKHTDAIPFAKKVLELAEIAVGTDHDVYIFAINNLAALYRVLRRYEEAESLLTQGLAITENTVGPDAPEVSIALNDLALLYHDQGRYAEAEPLYQRALRISERHGGSDHSSVAIILDNLATLNVEEGRYNDAELLYQRALRIRKKVLGPDHSDVSVTIGNLATLKMAQGRYTESESLQKQALAIVEKALGSDHPDVATILHNLGNLYSTQGRYEESEYFYKRSLAIREKKLGPDHSYVGSTLNSMAVLSARRGRYTKAKSIYRRVLAIYGTALSLDHPEVGATLGNLAEVNVQQGRYAEAESLYRRSLEIYEKAFGLDHPQVALGLNNLAAIYGRQERDDEAELLLKRSLAIKEKLLGPDHPALTKTLNNLAMVYGNSSRLAEAELLHKRNLAIYEKAFFVDHPDVALTINNLATLYAEQGHYSKAEPLLRRSLTIYENLFGPDHPEVVVRLNNLAEVYERVGRFVEAEPLYQRALRISERQGSNHPTVATVLTNLALMRKNRDHYSEGLSLIRRATAIFRVRFAHLGIESTPSLLSQQRRRRASLYLHIDLALHSQQEGNRSHLEAEAFEVLQLARASSTAGAISRMAIRFATGSGEMTVFIRERQDALAYYEKLDADLIKVLSEAPETRNRESESRIRTAVETLKERLDKLEQIIKEKFPEYAELTRKEPLSLAKTQSLLQPEEALLTFNRSLKGDQTHVFVVRSNRATAYTVDLGVSELEEMVSQLRAGVDFRSLANIPAFDVDLAHALYQRLLAPAEEILTGVKHLLVVPDGALQSLPLQILVTEREDTSQVTRVGASNATDQRGIKVIEEEPCTDVVDQRGIKVIEEEPCVIEPAVSEFLSYANVSWLLKRYALTTLPSVASLRALRVLVSKTQAASPFIGFGDPVLGGKSDGSKGLKIASFYRGDIANVNEVRKLPSLPETAVELRAIAEYLGADNSAVYLQERATETQVKTLVLNQSKVVAFSTHGLVSGDLKGLVEPALVLTPPREATAIDDGLLTASEVAQLKLDANWVILSACNTASGEKPGAEGLSGLAKAFFYAGTRALLVSHWPVESHATTDLITRMFNKIKEFPAIGRAEALRQSMLQLATNEIEPSYTHPFIWAPFVVVGGIR